MDMKTMNYNNGFADAVKRPVEIEFIDRTLIEGDEIQFTTTIDLTDSMNSTNAHTFNDSNSIANMSPFFVISNV